MGRNKYFYIDIGKFLSKYPRVPLKDPEKLKAYKQAWQKAHQAELTAKARERYQTDPAYRAERNAYYEENRQRLIEKAKEHYQANREAKLKYAAEYRAKNKDRLREYFRKLGAKNKPERIAMQKAAQKDWRVRNRAKRTAAVMARIKSDPSFRIESLLRCRVRLALKGAKKADRTAAMLGCSIDDFRKYFIGLFSAGMTWDDFMRGEIHIDHKRPCASFDLSDPIQQRECFHYTNLQPLWAEDNLRKGDLYNGLRPSGQARSKNCLAPEAHADLKTEPIGGSISKETPLA